MSNNSKFDQKGLTIIELMLGLLISSMVMATFMVVTKNYSNSANVFRNASKLSLSIRSFSDHLNLHASSAGFSPIGSSLSPIVSAKPFSLNQLITPVGNRSGIYSDVTTLSFVYDSNTSTREYALYEVATRSKKGRNQKYLTLTRRYLESGITLKDMFQKQIVLDDVQSFRCNQRLVGATPRAMDCQLVVFTEDPPSIRTLTHDFTIATLQTY